MYLGNDPNLYRSSSHKASHEHLQGEVLGMPSSQGTLSLEHRLSALLGMSASGTSATSELGECKSGSGLIADLHLHAVALSSYVRTAWVITARTTSSRAPYR